MYDCVIIGGGAAGLLSACRLAQAGRHVVVSEKQPRVGRKLLSTGNGRCNLTHIGATEADYHGDRAFIRAVLAQYPPEKVIDVFETMGLFTVTDEENRVYPASGQAASVLDALRLYAAEHGAEFRTEVAATALRREKGAYAAMLSDGSVLRAKCVLIACGGCAAPKLGGCSDGVKLLESFGHTAAPMRPALAPLKTDPVQVRALKGIRAAGSIALYGNGKCLRTERGEILFGDGAISGIAAMQLARYIEGRGRYEAGLCFAENAEAAVSALRRSIPGRHLEDMLSGLVPKRLGQTLLRAANVQGQDREVASLTDDEARSIAQALTDWRLPVLGTQGFDNAQVTVGGIRTKDFDPRTMASKLSAGLFAAGEVLDVDGDCGGFNLQWAWATALIAADAIGG